MSRVVSGKMRLDVQSIDICEVIGAAIETVRPAADAKNIHLHTVLDPRHGPRFGRRGPVAAGDLESAVERHQVHAQRRARAGVAGARQLAPGNPRVRHRSGNRGRVPALRLRPLPPTEHDVGPTIWRPRAGIVDRQATGGAARRHGAGDKRRRRAWQHVHRLLARADHSRRSRPRHACIRRRNTSIRPMALRPPSRV